ncbi:hypothetical protein [Mucilaginibacter paludis]|uniref:Uncharacterized protein n=1 Tax=Mucilaginibacter paludis DSM 18603 TaxID=714943 RepID=H1YB30_9SPHI|nr:hypothetical protein [Mucilaginibacter paludis]EHQ30063.1 hypothetical protein Mucpa_6004 [Mucilaginibacter paludis DSM 18603]
MGIEEMLLAEAKEEGKIEGKLQGKLEGKLEGEREKALAIATEMKKDGIPNEQIARFTKLPVEYIEKL